MRTSSNVVFCCRHSATQRNQLEKQTSRNKIKQTKYCKFPCVRETATLTGQIISSTSHTVAPRMPHWAFRQTRWRAVCHTLLIPTNKARLGKCNANSHQPKNKLLNVARGRAMRVTLRVEANAVKGSLPQNAIADVYLYQ